LQVIIFVPPGSFHLFFFQSFFILFPTALGILAEKAEFRNGQTDENEILNNS